MTVMRVSLVNSTGEVIDSFTVGPNDDTVAEVLSTVIRSDWENLSDGDTIKFEEIEEDEDDGQPDEAQEWADFDPEC